MLSNKTTLLVLSTLLAGAMASPIPAPTTGCAAVHIITARASTERPGEGIIGAVVSDVVSRSKQTVSREAVDYPALLAPYLSSEAAGVTAMKTLLARQSAACPDTKIVLMGYSQGAQVSGDVLQANAPGTDKGENTSLYFRQRPDIVPYTVAAVVLMGDPAHVSGESFQKGRKSLSVSTLVLTHSLPRYRKRSRWPFRSPRWHFGAASGENRVILRHWRCILCQWH